jgi:tryptophan synthase alpha subunit
VSRIAARFAELGALGRAGFIPFITAGDPDAESSFEILQKLAGVGADLIELGMPFSDPMADGPAVQAASMRALKAGMTLKGTLHLVERFRARDDSTPIVLMGYYNPIHAYGAEHFLRDAAYAGVDGLIIVDLGPEEDSAFRAEAAKRGLDIVPHPRPTMNGSRRCSMARAAFSITSRLPASPAPRRLRRQTSARPLRASAVRRGFPARWASASRRRNRPPKSPVLRMRPLWVRRSSHASKMHLPKAKPTAKSLMMH